MVVLLPLFYLLKQGIKLALGARDKKKTIKKHAGYSSENGTVTLP
jgi:hypothetical protein